jgi:hypothetical protein
VAETDLNAWTHEYLAFHQQCDVDINQVRDWLLNKQERPRWHDIKSSSPALRAMWQQWDSLCVMNDIVYRKFYHTDGSVQYFQIILPNSLRAVFLELVHADAAGHLKVDKTIEHVQRRAWWFLWRRSVRLFVAACRKCCQYHRGSAPKQGKLQPMCLGAPGERWCIDLCGPFPLSNGYKYLFTAICPFSKFGVAVPIRNKEASTVAKVLVEHVLLKWGLCFEVLHDQGPEFEAVLTSELLNVLGINNLRSSGYKASTGGVVERWHRVLNSLLAKIVSNHQRDWSQFVSYAVFCYNASQHSATSLSPFLIMTGRECRWNIDFLLSNPQPAITYDNVASYTADILYKLDETFNIVREHLGRSAQQASLWYNRKVKPREFAEGCEVYIYCPRRFRGRTPKWQSFYQAIGKVERKFNDVTYVVSSPAWKSSRVVHVDKLKHCLPYVDSPAGDRLHT